MNAMLGTMTDQRGSECHVGRAFLVRKWRQICSINAAIGVCWGGAAADWPQFRGPDANGISRDTGLEKDWKSHPPTELWRIKLTDGGYAGPSVAGGRVFIVDHQRDQDIVRALDLSNGQEIWSFAYPDSEKPTHGFAKCTPTICGGKVYVLSRLGRLHCINAASGESIFSRDLVADFKAPKPVWDYSSSPVIDESRVIISPGGTNCLVVALDRDTGRTVWQGGGDDLAGYATPVVARNLGPKQYVIFAHSGLFGVDAEDGRRRWFYPWQCSGKINASTPIIQGGCAFISSGYGGGCALIRLEEPEPKLLWKNRAIQAQFSTPVVHDGHIYGTTDPGDLVCLEWQTGREKWRQKGFEKGGLIAVDGVIVALDGKEGFLIVAALDPSGYREFGRVQPLGGRSWTAPVLAERKLLIRNKSFMVCLDISRQGD